MPFRMNRTLALLALGILAAVSVYFFAVADSRSTNSAAPASAAQEDAQNLKPRPGTVPQQLFSAQIDNEAWSLTSFENEIGQWCAGETISSLKGEWSRRCIDPNTAYDKSPLVFSVSSRALTDNQDTWNQVWVWGWASPAVSKLELTLSSCRSIPIHINREKQLFFHVLPRALAGSGIVPIRLVAYDTSGATLADEETPLLDPRTSEPDRSTAKSCS